MMCKQLKSYYEEEGNTHQKLRKYAGNQLNYFNSSLIKNYRDEIIS